MAIARTTLQHSLRLERAPGVKVGSHPGGGWGERGKAEAGGGGGGGEDWRVVSCFCCYCCCCCCWLLVAVIVVVSVVVNIIL